MRLNKEGFITHYLISGPREIPYMDENIDKNQLLYEQKLRSFIAVQGQECPTDEIILHADSELNMPWDYYFSYGNWFVDKSNFYSTLEKVELVAVVNLEVAKDMELNACLWSYAAIDCWLNQEKVGEIKEPIYKPIFKMNMILKLHKGNNQLYIKMQNAGIRDTRNIFGIQILERQSEIIVNLPDEEQVKPFVKAEEWLEQIKMQGHSLIFSSEAPTDTNIGYNSQSRDLTLGEKRIEWFDISGQASFELESNHPFVIVVVKVVGKALIRRFELLEEVEPIYLKKESRDENMQEVYKNISKVVKLDRGNQIGFSMINILSRVETDRFREDDLENIYETLDQIESRMDCSDFLLCALIRFIKNNNIDTNLQKRVKEVLLNFRYWMDEEGSDAMCFWSENHSLMFYVCAMNAGEMYPEDQFNRSNKTGKQLYESSRKKVLEWLTDVEEYGFEEFLSGSYMCITFAALLNTIDFSDEEISTRAMKIADQILYLVSIHTFQGSAIAPQGRVYRDVIYPFTQGLQALINVLNPAYAYTYSEGWMGFLATSKYQIPTEMISHMYESIQREYQTGNALVRLNKTKYYVMTSVQSPREDVGFKRWENISFEEKSDVNSQAYIKSLNERYHGTTCFEPGVYGYQQHLWSIALAPDTIVFVNHPGAPCDGSSMRPGYWYGNGVMPAIKQMGAAIASIYVISDKHPIDFTHIHWPNIRFDEIQQKGSWLIGKKGNGYVGIWCSGEKEAYSDQLFDVEYRIYGRKAAYLCVCNDNEECHTLEAFYEFCDSYQPYFDENILELHTNKKISLKYVNTEDKTQII
ncbi:MAG: hypothetical protein ACERKZ_10985 [Lachnotalea sp.]